MMRIVSDRWAVVVIILAGMAYLARRYVAA